jgi:NADH-quinone oxidoreductase subunit A
MGSLIFSPLVAFILFFVIFAAFSKGISGYSHYRSESVNEIDAYACGQKNIRHYVNPDFRQFFPYAFFYTIMHVLVLIVATAPYDAPLLPVIYIVSGILSIVIIFKR